MAFPFLTNESVSVQEVSYFDLFLQPCLVLGHFLGEDKFWAKILKTDDFVSFIVPQKQPRQNNYCIP